ncbi:cytochrome c oxidase assembly protein [Streptacidiphilus sp. MAP5-3]|uniref:cytochrome c oxidase assembly protein n=1 Tax=unclassified Streptacidiphilus TaxID=2643834 RepID=UPI0035148A3E
MNVALGYAGPPAWTLSRVVGSWQLEPTVVAITLVAAVGYLVGVIRVRRSGGGLWPLQRIAAFFGGLALWIVVCCSGLGVYERFLFTDRALQAVLLLMVVPLLLALGAPVSLLVQAAPERLRAHLEAALAGRVSRVLMFPLVSTVLLIVPPWLFYFTSWYENSLTSSVWNTAFHLGFVAFGLAYFWPRLQIDPVPHHYHPLLGVLITIAEVIFDAALGFVLVFGGHLVASHYWDSLHRPWGWSPLQDQKWGGAVLWGLGDIAGVPFMVALIIRVVKEERLRTRVVDEELDRIEQEAASASASAPPVGTAAAVASAADKVAATQVPELPETSRPWWETDPRLAHRYGSARDAED